MNDTRKATATCVALVILSSVGCAPGRDRTPLRDAQADAPPGEPLADFRYTLGCGSRIGCLARDRDINAFNGEGGAIITCAAGMGAAGALLDFSMSALDPIDGTTRFGFEVSNVIYDEASGSPIGTSGRVTVTEGSNIYTAAVSGSPPSLPVGCQLQNITKSIDYVGNSQIEGDILCGAAADPAIGLSQSGTPTERRDIYSPGSPSTHAHFRIVLCPGL